MPKNQQFENTVTGTPRTKRRRRRNTAAFTKAADGKRAAWPGRKARTPEPSSAAQDRRQSVAYELHVQGKSQSEIARELGIDRGTVALDILMEFGRRAAERPAERERAIRLSVGRLERVILSATTMRLKLQETGDITDAKVQRAVVESEKLILAAQSQIDQLLGLVPPAPRYSRNKF